ncbi:MAG: hypothetical protein NVS9B1_25180 [Candidatus Dormibacteraceae bacterium]
MADHSSANPEAQTAAVYRYAVELVEETRRAADRRLADARELAAVVRIADESAADRILAAAVDANTRDLATAENQAEEVVKHARAGIMAAVQRYADSLLEETRRANEARMPRARELAELIRLADGAAADRLLDSMEDANKATMKTAEQQATGVISMAEQRLIAGGGKPRHRHESGEEQVPAEAGAGEHGHHEGS